MIDTTVAWIALPFFTGFVIYLVPKMARWLAIGIALVSAAYAGQIFLGEPLNIQLLDSFGVSLIIDRLSGFFILTNAVVTAAVIIYCWQSGKTAFFYMQATILHGSVNATFICADFISLYVALEVISIAAFLLITYPRSDRSIWVGLRYLFVSNTAMLFYLVGAVLVYKANNSFHYEGLLGSPSEAVALIFLGLLAKGGIFVSGLWLPLTHSESQSPVSAMLSGVVVKAGVFPIVRCALLLEAFDPIVRIFGVGTALLGVFWAIFEKDTKRTLAFSTISQLGFILAAPEVGGFYALTHGLVKSALFLISGILPSRNFQQLQSKPINTLVWIALVIASFSISGFPLLSGFGAKILTAKNLLPWQVIAMNLATVGTTIVFAKFIFLPHKKLVLRHDDKADASQKIQSGFWWAMLILLGGLIVANIVYYEAYTLQNIIKPLVTIAIGWLAYFVIFKKLVLKLPRWTEKFDHLIGVMSLMLIVVFWMVRV
ncbi:Cation:proton antiporter [Hyella patelloides LEGE 07179]|uniref:Cation:proton antiporter n=1 Tax=Hyella patelloides LEGE 07179 TaxID=945734 RepID=A0A563VSN1_9CYAN|nr:cation:proton antiporter [Hyella patelloides]VEP14396.1 Cation:proton antiporter [Hyella patelloides LEGE 07179]